MYKKEILKNKLRFVTIPMKGTRTATVLVLVGAGSKYETKENNGMSHFLEHMFFKGTKKRPTSLDITSELDSVGADYNAFTTKEFTGYWVKVDSSKIEFAADIVSDMLLNSKFEAREIEKEKGVIIEEINMYHDNPMMHIEDIFEECLYGDTPAGWEIVGPKKNILRFDRKNFVDYFNSHYGAENTVVCLAGNINNKKIQEVKKYFLKFNNYNLKEKREVIEKQNKPQIKISYKKTNQANLSLGVRAYPVNNKNEFALKLMSIILGGSMSSRLFSELREKRGLAYYVRTQSEFYTDSGYLTTQVGVPTEKIEEVIEIIIKEYKKLTKNLVNNKELKRTKDLIKGRLTIQLESSDDVANWYAKHEVIRGEQITPDNFFKRMESVKPGDIKKVAQEIFENSRLNLAIIGPYREDKIFKKIVKF